MIQAYSYRFKIEVSFKVMKHLLRSFFYQFRAKALPKLERKDKTNPSNLHRDSRRWIGSAAMLLNDLWFWAALLQVIFNFYPSYMSKGFGIDFRDVEDLFFWGSL